VALSLSTHVLVIYVPVLQTAFHTVALSAFDWMVAAGVAATLLVVMEVVKWVARIQSRTAPAAAHRRERASLVPSSGETIGNDLAQSGGRSRPFG
jgi:ABC-type transport system involved in cytochrome bd biosynthesis fused ATPase/permease subunit